MNWERAGSLLVVVSLLAIVGLLAVMAVRPVLAPVVNVPAAIVNAPEPRITTGTLAGESGSTSSMVMFMTDCPHTNKKSIPVDRYPTPASVVVRDGQVSYLLANGSGGAATSIGSITIFNGTISPSAISTLTLTSLNGIAPQLTPSAYQAVNDSLVSVVNTSSNISVNNYVPILLFKISVPTTRFNNATVQINVNATNLSTPGLRINLTSMVYNFTLGAYQFANWSGTQAISAATGNLTWNASIQGNFSSQLIGPDGTIYVVIFPGNTTIDATTAGTGTFNVNGSNTTISLGWASATFYRNTTNANYSLNISLYGATATQAVNVTIFGLADNGNLVRESANIANAHKSGTYITLTNFTEIFLITKNTTVGDVRFGYVVDNAPFTSLNSTVTNGIFEAYPCTTYNGTNYYVLNHSIATDSVDISPYRYCTVYMNMTTGSALVTATSIYSSPDNKTWLLNGVIGGAMSTTVNTKFLSLNDTAARYFRFNTMSTGIAQTPASIILSCKA